MATDLDLVGSWRNGAAHFRVASPFHWEKSDVVPDNKVTPGAEDA